MSLSHNLSSYVKKLGHPLKEIRERALQLLLAKFQLGYELEDDLAGTRELLEMLIAWFHLQQPTLQKEALCLLLSTLKTKAGTYIAKEYGIHELLSDLYRIKQKLAPDAVEVYEDVIVTLQFLNSIQSDDNVGIPRLEIPSVSSSETELAYDNGFYNLRENLNNSFTPTVTDESCEENIENDSKKAIKVLLFPWADLCSSDAKTLILVEDALRLLKSTKRCCRFICDVFLRDFPAEVFLNRPSIIQNLLIMVGGSHSGHCGEAMQVLLCIIRSLRLRLRQLTNQTLMHMSKKIDSTKLINEDVQLELDEIVGGDVGSQCPRDNGLLALKQLPAPYFALDSMHTLLSLMARSIVLLDCDNKIFLDMNVLSLCTLLVEELMDLLLECVDGTFWKMEHSTKTHRDIAHKSCMCMRLLGDLLNKYSSTYSKVEDFSQYRTAWLRLIICANKWLHWCQCSSLPPTCLVKSLYVAQLDPALSLFFPALANSISSTLQISIVAKDNNFKRKYNELKNLYKNMDACTKFIKNKDACRSNKSVIDIIKQSLPVLELHQSETFVKDVAKILLIKLKDWDLNDLEWNQARNITLILMAHNLQWVSESFYKKMADSVRNVLTESDAVVNEKSLILLCDVGVLSEICCHGLSSKYKQVESSACEIMMLLLRGRLLLAETCWWRLLATLLPILPLLHSYAEHDTQLGQAICKSLELDIAECMGVSHTEVLMGLVRLLFVKCPTIQMDASHSICHLLDDTRYLPPRESLRGDVLINALQRVKPEGFNVDHTTGSFVSTALLQVFDVLKQDLHLEEDNMGLSNEYISSEPTLEPSLRRATLQQLSLLMRRPELHDKFVEHDGIRIVVTLLRMSLLIDDHLAFPECALSCVSVLNSVCYMTRHALAKIHDLPALLIRVILVFPANESTVLMAAQVLGVVAWSGFILQELDKDRKRVLALPLCVVERTSLPFPIASYWDTSPTTEHSALEWLLNEHPYRAAIRVRWSYAWNGSAQFLRDPSPPPGSLSLRITDEDMALLQATCPLFSSTKALLALQNATSHKQVNEALSLLECYCRLVKHSSAKLADLAALPWRSTMSRYLTAAPASPKDVVLLITLLKFIITYIKNMPSSEDVDIMEWIKDEFLENFNSLISLLSKDYLFPQQTAQDSIELTQLHIHIVKVLLQCIVMLEQNENYVPSKLESLLKIVLACLGKVDIKNFHMLGYLNELVKCTRYLTHSRHCSLSENVTDLCMRQVSRILCVGAGENCKGQACRLDATLTLITLLTHTRVLQLPVQRWGDIWTGDVMHGVVAGMGGASAELRAASLQLLAVLVRYTQLMPHLQQALQGTSMPELSAAIVADKSEANVVRSAAANVLTAISARASPHAEVFENDILDQLKEHNFLDHCLQILVDFCKQKEHEKFVEPNVAISMLERLPEIEVRARKCGDIQVSPKTTFFVERVPPTAELVVTIADVIHNVAVFTRCPVQVWNEQGLFRLMFRCSWWGEVGSVEGASVREAMCRALARVAASNKCVRMTLAATKDCLHSLLYSVHSTPLEKCDDIKSHGAVSQGLLLLGVLLSEISASETIWLELNEIGANFFHLVLNCIKMDNAEVQKCAMYCVNQLCQALKHTKDSFTELFNNIKVILIDKQSIEDKENNITDDCNPEYITEELCKALITLYKKSSMDFRNVDLSQDDFWIHVCSSLASLLSHSARARMYAVHRGFNNTLVSSLQLVRDHLSFHGKPAEVIRNALTNPMLCTLQWILVVIDCMMTNCVAAKESFADNISNSLNRLWPWCMLTEQLRDTVVHLLNTFTNNCPKAWSAMCSCVSGRCLAVEMCALVSREAALQSRTHSSSLIVLALDTLTHCISHNHARPVILKTEVLQCVYKLRVSGGGGACAAWARLAAAAARASDGAARVLALRPPPPAALALPALANAAHHHRLTFLQASDLLEVLSGALLTGDTAQLVGAGRAVWALAANNHKAKLALRSAGVSASVRSALERLRSIQRDAATERAIQLLTYTDTLLQTN